MTNLSNEAKKELTGLGNGGSVKKNRGEKIIKRRERRPLEDQRRLLDIPQDPDYKYRLVSDAENRIASFYDAGYEIVDRDGKEVGADPRIQDSSWRQSAASQPVGGGIIGYIMRIPKEWYNEDQEAKQKRISDLERTMMRNKKDISQSTGDKEDAYYGDIRIEHNK